MTRSSGWCRAAAVAVLVAMLHGAAVVPTLAQPFVPSERPATSNPRLLDPEFNQGKALATWVDVIDGSIWLTQVDRVTGEFVPETGRGVLIEKSAAPPGGLGFTLNGPEWVLGASRDAIVYTRMPQGAPPTPDNAQIGVATQNRLGHWVVLTLSPGRPLNGPYGSDTPNDPAPRITYNDAQGNHFWRELYHSATEEPIPGAAPGYLMAIRHVRGEGQRALVYPVKVGGTQQVHRFDLNTRVFEQLTSDAGKKEQPWMWRAPDFDNDLVMLTTVDESSLALYRHLPDHTGTWRWTPIHSIAAPLEGRIFSTEPFVYDGRSYVLMMVIVGAYPTSIWLANFDAQNPILRRLTPELPDRARADPEVFFTDNGPIVYFSRFDPTKGSYWLCVPCSEGLYRAETGIPPAR